MNAERGGTITLGSAPLTIDDVERLAHRRARLVLSDAPDVLARLRRSREVLEQHVASGHVVYGVTTGFGESCVNAIEAAHQDALAANLVRFHGVGTGDLLDPVQGRAVLVARLAALVQGGSAIRLEVLELLLALLDHDLIPAIPAEGSVGASGDLTPLSYVAAVLMGEREVWRDGEVVPSAEALAEAGLTPVVLQPKESLALMNGTSVMTGLACLAWVRAERVARLACTLTGMASDVLRGNASHFDDRIFAAKPHPGQRQAAAWVRAHLAYDPATHVDPDRIQDRYSIRCAPHVIGVLLDALPFLRGMLEVELNGVNDNPVIDPDTGAVLHGGNFYGGHVAFAMDALKAAVASVADLLDRQMELMGNPASSNGLPGNLVAPGRPGHAASHGVKAMQIATSALTAEALKLTMPAASFSRSTESHNQDKVSMGTIAARDALRVVELTERVAAIHLLAACQAVDLRGVASCRAASAAVHGAVRQMVPFTDVDRRHDRDIVRLVELVRREALPLPVSASPLAASA
ncbi:MAG: aromatic amino acid lyase [Alphaproteobacteria bacterium]|nr:aromatic amino acid lyase [Alphaproteobacteria bacterium]